MADEGIPLRERVCKVCGGGDFSPVGKCRPCWAAYMRVWGDKNREKKRSWDKRRWDATKDEVNARRRGTKNKDQNAKAAARKKAWYLANRERIAAETKERYARNRAADLTECRAKVAASMRRRRVENPRFRAHEKMSRLVAKTLKRHRTSKQGRTWPELVGYTIVELEARLKATMPAGYTWADYLDGLLQIDHIIPASVFNFTSPDDIDFKRCWALANLRLLTKEDNYAKRAKLFAPFQPSLALAVSRGAAV